MNKVTAKNTKTEILEAYEAAMKKIAELKEGKTSTADIVKAKEIKEIKEKAKEIIELNILNDDIKDKYTALLKTVDLLEKEIEELYGIKREADSLEALINANKDKNRELTAKYEKQVNDLSIELADEKLKNSKKVKELNEEYEKKKAELRAEFEEEKARLQKERVREKEEFEYTLKRERQKDNDAWQDEKEVRESKLAAREKAVSERESKMDDMESKIEELNDHIVKLNDKIQDMKDQSFKEGKDKAAKEYAIQKNMIEKEANWSKERLEEKIANLEKELQNERDAHRITAAKLDDAYVQVREIATKTVEANGSVRIVDNSKN